MDGFKNIEINNFRGVKHLEIDDFSRVNVFLGQNSSGKSTVLEAIHLLTNMSDSDIAQGVNRIRTRNFYTNFKDIPYLFYNMAVETPVEIFAEQTDNEKRQLRLKMTYVFDGQAQLAQPKDMNGMPPVSETKTFLNTLEMDFESHIQGDIKKYQSLLTAKPDGIVTNKTTAEGYLEKYGTAYLTADLWGVNIVTSLSELFKRKKKNIVLQRLAHFDRSIVDIDILQDDIYVDFENISEKLPLRMTGDGLRRYLSIVAASANPMNNIILIDEIDNGLHYSAYKKLWEAIFALAIDTNKQVFITTHSKETLYRLNEMLEEHPDCQQEFRLYTIANTLKKGHQAYKYTFEGLQGACENDVEIRGMVI